jgi:ABC-type antimicrobial peptide transport system permease subunit
LVAIASPSGQKALLRASSKLRGVQSRSDIVEASTEPVQINRKPLNRVVWPSGAAPDGDTADEQGRAFSGVTGLDLRHGQNATDLRIVTGRMLGPADAGSSNALVRSELLYPPYNLKEGDSVTLREPGSGRTATIRVAGFYERSRRRGFSSFFRAPIYADRSVALAVGGQDAQLIISYSVSPDQLTHDATQLQRQAAGSLVVDIGDLTAVVETILNELLNLLAVITALGLGAGLAVVGNGVALAMLERRREMALYKAIGFGPRSVLRFVLVENALGGTLAGAVSVMLVAALLTVISHLALQKAIGFDPVVAVVVLAGATLLALVTAYLAARTPVRVRPIEVLRNE